MDKRILYIWLNSIRGVGPVIGNRLINFFGSIEKVYDLNIEEILGVQGIGEKLASEIVENKSLEYSKETLSYCIKNNIGIAIREDEKYPSILKEYDDAPNLLYYKGNIERINNPVAIIGTRDGGNCVKQVCINIASELADNKVQVISGLSKGVGSYVHTVSVNKDNFNVGVIGTGIDICYPKEHQKLYKKIIENGVVISQFNLGTSNIKANFIKRNKLIMMLSSKVVVIDGEKESSVLYAIKVGSQLGKKINIISSEICNDVLPNDISKQQGKIINLLKNKECYKDELVAILDIENDILEEDILELEMKELIFQRGGKIFLKSSMGYGAT